MNQHRLGFACKFIGPQTFPTRTCLMGKATPEKLLETSRENLAALSGMINSVAMQGLGLFRISSDIIPLASHPDIHFDWQGPLAEPLAAIGRQVAAHSVRVSMHPGQYTVLNSPDAGVVARAMLDLSYHASFLDALDAPPSCKIILHVGGVYGDKQAAMERFSANYKKLPENVRKRLVLENDERCFAIHEVLELCTALSIPAVMDVLHHAILPAPHGTALEWLHACAATWKPQDGRQKIHYSQQEPGGKKGAHSQTIAVKPFMEFMQSLGSMELDTMLEVKDKNISAIKCSHCLDPALRPAKLQEAWSRYKYLVMEHSHHHYQQIRQEFAQSKPGAFDVYTLIDTALRTPPDKGSLLNAAQHVWGYVSAKATDKEKKQFVALCSALEATPEHRATIKRFLLRLAGKQQCHYLLESLYFYLSPV